MMLMMPASPSCCAARMPPRTCHRVEYLFIENRGMARRERAKCERVRVCFAMRHFTVSRCTKAAKRCQPAQQAPASAGVSPRPAAFHALLRFGMPAIGARHENAARPPDIVARASDIKHDRAGVMPRRHEEHVSRRASHHTTPMS